MQSKYVIVKSGTTITVSNSNGMSHVYSKENGSYKEAEKILMEHYHKDMTEEDVTNLALTLIADVSKMEVNDVDDNNLDVVVDNIDALNFLNTVGIKKVDGVLMLNGEPLDEESPLVGVILSLLVDGEGKFEAKKKFLTKLLESHFNIEQITQICNFMLGRNTEGTNDYNITDEGNFLLYRGVNYRESHDLCVDWNTGKIPQKVGWTIKMPATLVDKDPTNTCSHGLHVATLDYAEGFARHVQIVELDPRNIVSVPTDYGFQKIRTTEYKILGFLDEGKNDSFGKGNVLEFLDEPSFNKDKIVFNPEQDVKTITVGRHGEILSVEV